MYSFGSAECSLMSQGLVNAALSGGEGSSSLNSTEMAGQARSRTGPDLFLCVWTRRLPPFWSWILFDRCCRAPAVVARSCPGKMRKHGRVGNAWSSLVVTKPGIELATTGRLWFRFSSNRGRLALEP